MDGKRTSDEIIVVFEGALYVSGGDEPEEVAGPGDVVAVMHGRETRIRVKERTRAFFILWNTDPEEIMKRMQGEGELNLQAWKLDEA
jgi:ethanolamine utilization protein EutQ (cupin superfamily)